MTPDGSFLSVKPAREDSERHVRADLWSAVWEASQFLTFEQIRELVEGTLREIQSDEE